MFLTDVAVRSPDPVGGQHAVPVIQEVPDCMAQRSASARSRNRFHMKTLTHMAKQRNLNCLIETWYTANRRIAAHLLHRHRTKHLLYRREHHQLSVIILTLAQGGIDHGISAQLRNSCFGLLTCRKNFIRCIFTHCMICKCYIFHKISPFRFPQYILFLL